MTVDQAIRRYPEHTDAIRAVVDALRHYPDHDWETIDAVDPVPPDHPDRFIELFAPYDANTPRRVEFTHLIRASYCEDYGCLYGVTTTGEVHLWSDWQSLMRSSNVP